MHVFLLSLPDSRVRRLSAIAKLQACQIPFEIVDGVEASKLRPEYVDYHDDARAWMKPTEVGCYMAHLRALQRMLDYRLPYVCILEDDFCFEAEPDWGLNEIEQHIPGNFHYIQLQRDLGINPNYRDAEQVGGFIRMIETPYMTTGYIIQHTLAAYIVKHEQRCRMPIDHLFCELSHHGKFYRPVKPLVGIQVGLASDTHI